MSEIPPDYDRLLDEAIDLAIRLQSDPGNPVALGMIQAWRARSPTHEKVWSRVSVAHDVTGKILTGRRKKERREQLGLTRRNLVIGGAVGLGAAASGSLLLPDLIVQAHADHVTGKAEIREVALPDGSRATLGPDSALALAYEPGWRKIELLKGMSFFEVAEEAGRPFQVRSGDFTVTALGTAFDVSSDAGLVSTSVSHGRVETRASSPSLAGGVQLSAGDWLSFDPSRGVVERGQRETGQIASWRDNLVIAEREPVSVLIARIGRWYPGRIVIADPFIGSQKISGLFDLKDPLRALEAVVHPAGGRVRRISSFLTFVSPV